MSTQQHILWADDEIDLLKPHLLFLRSKGYDVVTANNGRDALDMATATPFDLIILDERVKATPSPSKRGRCSGQPGAVRPAWSTTRWQG